MRYSLSSGVCNAVQSIFRRLLRGTVYLQAFVTRYSLSQAFVRRYSLSQAFVTRYSLSQAFVRRYSLSSGVCNAVQSTPELNTCVGTV